MWHPGFLPVVALDSGTFLLLLRYSGISLTGTSRGPHESFSYGEFQLMKFDINAHIMMSSIWRFHTNVKVNSTKSSNCRSEWKHSLVFSGYSSTLQAGSL